MTDDLAARLRDVLSDEAIRKLPLPVDQLRTPAHDPHAVIDYPQPPDGWVCFHCGDRFTTWGAARDHFGATPEARAGCVIKVQVGDERGLLMEVRKLEARVSAAERPAQTCSTCQKVHAIAERMTVRPTMMGCDDIDDLVEIVQLTDDPNYQLTAAPRSVVAPEKE